MHCHLLKPGGLLQGVGFGPYVFSWQVARLWDVALTPWSGG